MEIPPIHCCNMLTIENEALSKKYHKLTRKYKVLEKQFAELREKLIREAAAKEVIQAFQRDEVVSNLISQNQPSKMIQGPVSQGKRRDKQRKKLSQEKKSYTEEKTYNKRILSMHNELIKKYEKEMKLNTSRVEQITRLALEKGELQQALQKKDQQITVLQKQLEAKQRQQRIQETEHQLRKTPGSDKAVKSENRKLKAENIRLREELQGLDKEFFEEIEDLKYALQKSAKLNREYEKALEKLCIKHGADFVSLKDRSKERFNRQSRDRKST